MSYDSYLYKPFNPQSQKQLEQFDEFKFSIPNKSKVIDYMILMYDHANTEFRRLYPDYYTRKRVAAEQAGFKLGSNGRFPEEIENIIIGLNDDFNTALVRYLMLFSLPDYPALVALKEMQAQELRAAFTATDAKDRKIIRDNMQKITDDISVLEDRIYTGTETENVRKAIYKYMEAQRLRLRPEDIAKATRTGKIKEVLGL